MIINRTISRIIIGVTHQSRPLCSDFFSIYPLNLRLCAFVGMAS
jgi:hypothetical protein